MDTLSQDIAIDVPHLSKNLAMFLSRLIAGSVLRPEYLKVSGAEGGYEGGVKEADNGVMCVVWYAGHAPVHDRRRHCSRFCC